MTQPIALPALLPAVIGLALMTPHPAWGQTSPQVRTFEATITDPARSRLISYLVYDDPAQSFLTPLILVSHGGPGSPTGHLRGEHLGTIFAQGGYVAIHVGHRESANSLIHQQDRPADVSFIIDQIQAGSLPLPAGLAARIDPTRIGHTGHSFGAYSTHALAGTVHEPLGPQGPQATYTDPRIRAFAPLSPQGADQFGFFDRAPGDNSWTPLTAPVCTFIGELEIDSNAIDTFTRQGWRLEPFNRYTFIGDRYLFIIPGQDHNDLWFTGSPQVNAFVAGNARRFFDATLRGEVFPPSQIGLSPAFPGVESRVKSTDFNADTSRDMFDLLLYLDRHAAGDPAAEATADVPVSLTTADIAAFIHALARPLDR